MMMAAVCLRSLRLRSVVCDIVTVMARLVINMTITILYVYFVLCAVSQLPGKTGAKQVLIQGNQVKIVASALLG